MATTGKVSLGEVACLCQAAADHLINGRIDVGDAVKSLKLNFYGYGNKQQRPERRERKAREQPSYASTETRDDRG